jgi:hypothetical protein
MIQATSGARAGRSHDTHMPVISLVAAMARNRVIGAGNRLPWHLPADLAHFKRLTHGHHLIVGRDAQRIEFSGDVGDFEGDVETISHPKNALKRISPRFDEVEHGRLILERLLWTICSGE